MTSIKRLTSKHNCVVQSYPSVTFVHGLLFTLIKFCYLYYHNHQLKNRGRGGNNVCLGKVSQHSLLSGVRPSHCRHL